MAMSSGTQRKVYTLSGLALGILGIVWALAGWGLKDVGYQPVAGVSSFAVLYVIAHGTERVTEFVTNLLGLIPNSPEQDKVAAIRRVRRANSTLNGNPSLEEVTGQVDAKATGEAEAATARQAIAYLAQGLSIALAAVAVSALDYDLLEHVGAADAEDWLARLVTVLAAAGGTKALHELVGRLQKSKEAAETGARA